MEDLIEYTKAEFNEDCAAQDRIYQEQKDKEEKEK